MLIYSKLLIFIEVLIDSSFVMTGIKPAIALVGVNKSASGSKKQQSVNVGGQ